MNLTFALIPGTGCVAIRGREGHLKTKCSRSGSRSPFAISHAFDFSFSLPSLISPPQSRLPFFFFFFFSIFLLLLLLHYEDCFHATRFTAYSISLFSSSSLLTFLPYVHSLSLPFFFFLPFYSLFLLLLLLPKSIPPFVRSLFSSMLCLDRTNFMSVCLSVCSPVHLTDGLRLLLQLLVHTIITRTLFQSYQCSSCGFAGLFFFVLLLSSWSLSSSYFLRVRVYIFIYIYTSIQCVYMCVFSSALHSECRSTNFCPSTHTRSVQFSFLSISLALSLPS